MTIPQAFAMALQSHQSGRLAEAEVIYRQILAVEPRHADALHLLGVIAQQVGRAEVAVELIRQAIALQANCPAFHSNLGVALFELKRLEEAAAAYRQALELQPDYAEAQNNLGNVLTHQGRLDEALVACRRAIELQPDYADAHHNQAIALARQGRLDDAIAAYRLALKLNPSLEDAQSDLGNALNDQGQLDEAIAAYRQAIALKPNSSEAHYNLGIALHKKGQLDEAIAACRQAIALQGDYPEVYNNLGNALLEKGQLDEAIAAFRQAVILQPDYAEAYSNLGNALNEAGQPDEGLAAYRQALALKPDYAEAHCNLGTGLKDKGQLDEALAAFRQAIALKPNFSKAHSNLLLTLNYHPGFEAGAVAQEQRRWNRQHAEPLRPFMEPHRHDRSAERRLRIGYVSPDFREHAVGYNVLPLLSRHDPANFEVFCYAQVPRPDALTERFRASAQHWRSIVGLTDEQLAAQIREDRIDILVDLALHTGHHRLLVFARRPAPVQVTFAGYPGSTGMTAVDYRLSDPWLDPPGLDESIYAEQTVRLPHSFWCYEPLVDGGLPVHALPARSNGFITFGCLNNFCKINELVLRLWARVLHAVPCSRLLLLAPEGSHRPRLLEVLERAGIAVGRVEFVARRPRPRYLELYERIDLGLDTLPYSGHTTSLDALWMGVPVVTLVGQTIVGRAGLGQLMNLNLPELIAQTPDQYVQIAAELASDLPRLSHLRATLRQRMEHSPLMDAPRFARDIEAAYREMWRRWCRSQP